MGDIGILPKKRESNQKYFWKEKSDNWNDSYQSTSGSS
jgi:hypothetical protein